MADLKQIDEAKLESDLGYRFEYLTEFVGLTGDDLATVTGAAELLAPLVNDLVDAVYVKLFSYDCTKRHFLPRNEGYDGDLAENLDALTLEHEQIKFRKSHLAKYLQRLVTGPYDDKMVTYLDRVGAIHTPHTGSKQVNVPLVQMNALMGFVADAVNATILGFDIPAEARANAIRAFSKLLWIQNDLINRHYASQA